jgi:hypothetical protein
MTSELREVWVCAGCAMRVYVACGDPIPEPRKWEDSRCPHCRVSLARETEGNEAAQLLGEKLGIWRKHSAFKKPIAKRDDEPPTKRPGMGRDARRERKEAVKEAALAHPDRSNAALAEEIGIDPRTVGHYRRELGLARMKTGLSDDEREQIAQALAGPARPDAEIANEMGVKESAVAEVRKNLGLSAPRQRAKAERERRVAEVLAAHPTWGPKKIAEEVGVSLNSVRRSLAALRSAEPVPA